MSEAYLKLRAISNEAFEGDANLDTDYRLEIFLMKEGVGWHLGIRFLGYFHFRSEYNLDGTYGPGYLTDKIRFPSKECAECLQRLLKQFFKLYHTPPALRRQTFWKSGGFTVPDFKEIEIEEHEE